MEQGDRAMRIGELVAVMDRDLWVTCVAQLELGLLLLRVNELRKRWVLEGDTPASFNHKGYEYRQVLYVVHACV